MDMGFANVCNCEAFGKVENGLYIARAVDDGSFLGDLVTDEISVDRQTWNKSFLIS